MDFRFIRYFGRINIINLKVFGKYNALIALNSKNIKYF